LPNLCALYLQDWSTERKSLAEGPTRSRTGMAAGILTIFAVPKALRPQCRDSTKCNCQLDALQPTCEIILCGDDFGTEQAARDFGVKYLPNIARNDFSTPLIDSVLRQPNCRYEHLSKHCHGYRHRQKLRCSVSSFHDPSAFHRSSRFFPGEKRLAQISARGRGRAPGNAVRCRRSGGRCRN